jgi:hypothetical protein
VFFEIVSNMTRNKCLLYTGVPIKKAHFRYFHISAFFLQGKALRDGLKSITVNHTVIY